MILKPHWLMKFVRISYSDIICVSSIRVHIETAQFRVNTFLDIKRNLVNYPQNRIFKLEFKFLSFFLLKQY